VLAAGGLQLVGARAADDVPRAVGVGAPVALAVRVLEAAVALRGARRPVPAVDADSRRPVADVEAPTALAVRRADVAETHHVRQALPRKPSRARTHARARPNSTPGLPWGRNFYPHTHPIPTPMGNTMGIPIPTADL